MGVVTDLTPDDAEQIARALSEVFESPIMSDWIEITKCREAGRYTVTVVEEDVMARVYEYRDTPEWADIHEPMMAGYRLNGKKQYLRLDQHGQLIGMSTSGKSSLIHCMLAYATRCRNAIVWVGGVQKLYDLVAGWIECYKDTGIQPPIDYIANGKQDTLNMMAALMSVARSRQSAPMSERGGWPTIILILDEVSFALEDHTVSVYFDGAQTRADMMGVNILRGAASGDAYACLATQHDVNACFGDKGGTLTANLSYTGAFRIRDKDALGRMLGDWKLAMPRFAGEFWLDAGDGQLPFRVKAEYIQTADRSKPRLHNGLTVTDVAWNRRHFLRNLDPASVVAAGPHYARRFQLVDDAMLDYVMGRAQRVAVNRPAMPPGPSEPLPMGDAQVTEEPPADGIPECDRELAAIIARAQNAGVDLPVAMAASLAIDDTLQALVEQAQQQSGTDEAPPVALASVPSMVGRQSWSERILAVLRGSDVPLSRKAIIEALETAGHTVTNPQVISNALDRMKTPPSPALDHDSDGYRAL